MKIQSYLLLALIVCSQFISGQEIRNHLKTSSAPFYHGVASGDPLHDRVILWTRVTPEVINGDSISVNWRIATDTSMQNIVNSGSIYTSQNRDYTVKVDVIGLSPSTCYYYDFERNGNYSIIGRTITADIGDNEHVRFAVVSCSNYEYGYFNAYRAIAERNDVNAVLHLGDYIYEYETGGYSANISDRNHQPEQEIVTLDDYRLRYSHYRLDNDLQRIHQQYPFICVWDDHESANDSWKDGAENHNPTTEGVWFDRKNNSRKAYFEWLPIREKIEDSSIYRKIEYGDLLNLYMLDTRLEGRDEQVSASSTELEDSTRSILGSNQKNWLKSELSSSAAQWNILGQQVMMAPLEAFGSVLNTDQWDGYPIERMELLNYIIDSAISNVVILTGDIHSSWANDIPLSNYDASTGANSAAVEFVATSVTSPGFPIGFGESIITTLNPHIQWAELNQKGYVILDIDKTRTQGEWYFMDDVSTPGNGQSFAKAYFVNDQERFLNEGSTPSFASNFCVPAPTLTLQDSQSKIELFGIYPNPFSTYFILHLGSSNMQEIDVQLVDMSGKIVFNQQKLIFQEGSEYFKINTESLKTGFYNLILTSKDEIQSHKLIKF